MHCVLRRNLLRQVIGYLGLFSVFSLPVMGQAITKGSRATSRAKQPNIVVFLVDDMGWTDTSVSYHREPTELNRRYRTPRMQQLASQGVMFTQAYASAVCSPSRISLMTGMNEARHGVTNWTLDRGRSPDPQHPRVQPPNWPLNGMAAEPGTERTVVATPLPSLLQEAGYYTIHVGKAHFGATDTPGADPKNLGFDVNIAGHAAGGPGSYLGTNNFSAAHRNGRRVWDVPGLDQYHGQDIYLTEALTIEALKAVEVAVDEHKPFYLYMSHYAIHAPWEADKRFLADYLGKGYDGLPATYASMIESMDDSLGKILRWLSERGVEDNTLLVFMSDNGVPKQCPRNLPLRGHKLTPYEGGVRVPMIVRWPGRTSVGTRQDSLVKIEDLFPTILAAAGVEQPQTVQATDGVNFLPLLGTEADRPPSQRELVWHFPHTYDGPPWSMIRKGDWKFIWFYLDQRSELYNVAEDIGESINLVNKHPDVATELSAALRRQLVELGAQIPIDKQTGQPFGMPPGEEAFEALSRPES